MSQFLAHTPDPENCKICGLPMQKIAKPMFGDRVWYLPDWRGHEECSEAIKQIRLEEEQKKLRQEEQRLYQERLERGFGTTINWYSKTFETFTANASAKERALSWKFPERGFVFNGAPGSGKTHLMTALAQKFAAEERRNFCFIKISPWLDFLRSAGFEEQEDIVRNCERAPCLFVDDIGAEKLTEWGESKLERILDARSEFERPTFFSTNLTEDGLKKYLSPRCWSRLSALSEFILLTGRDHRQPIKRPQNIKGPVS